jgi:3,4-dihydroxy 2-butanone 4-phosphate synthase/GTP cyclohydrolase II
VSRIAAALTALAAGQMVVVADDSDRENEGDLVMAADAMTAQAMAFFLRHGSGIVCVALTDERADALGLPLMVEDSTDLHRTAFTVTVDHISVGTGISAADRCTTVTALAHVGTRPEELRRPGHVFPLRARRGGVLKRPGHTEAAVDLLRLAGRDDVGVITELVDDNGVPLAGDAIAAFAARHELPVLSVAELIRHRRATEALVRRSGEATLPTDAGTFRAVAYESLLDGIEHLALVHGDPTSGVARAEGALVRVHSECLTGDLFGSRRCDCGAQLEQSLEMIADAGVGVLVYLRGHEGRGIGLGHKLRAYALQEHGRDTVDANLELGLPVDSREYGIGAAVLADLGVTRLRLITNNPHKYGGLDGFDLEIVGRVATPAAVTPDNLAYLRTKRDRMGHLLHLPPTTAGASDDPTCEGQHVMSTSALGLSDCAEA